MSEAKEAKGVTINVMGREFRVAAPGGEERQLVASVEFLNKKMREIRDTGKVVGNERIAIMAALNIAHEYLQLQAGGGASASGNKAGKSALPDLDTELVRRKMDEFDGIIEKALADQEKLF